MKLHHGKLLDPRADLVFKKIFGQHPDLVKSFLNSLLPLPEDGMIETITYLPFEQIPRTPLQKFSVVDVRCTDQKGRIFIVEMQMGWSDSFKQRLQFGVSKAYVSQLDSGQHYNLLNPVYGLALVGDTFDPDPDNWYHHYKMINIMGTHEHIDGLELIFVELPKFKITTPWGRRLGVLWLRFLNEISSMGDIPEEFSDVSEISKAIQLTQEASFSKEELAAYDGYWDQIRIDKTIREDARREGEVIGLQRGEAIGLQRGEAIGLEKGREEGEAIGLEKGEAIGILKEKLNTARKMKDKNMSDEDIINFTGLSLQQLREI